jgi:hypothetical protein
MYNLTCREEQQVTNTRGTTTQHGGGQLARVVIARARTGTAEMRKTVGTLFAFGRQQSCLPKA